jgi:hypothetical protein
MHINCQSCDNRKFSIVAGLVIEIFGHHMFGDQKISITIFVVCSCDLAIYIKEYLKAKEESWKFQYFTMQKYSLEKTSFKRN